MFVVFLDFLFVFSYKVFFYCCSITVVQIFPHSSPLLCPHAPSILPLPIPTLLPCTWVIYTCSLLDPSPSFLLYPCSPSLLVAVSLFLVSMLLVLFCLFVCFVDYGQLIGEIIWYLSFTTWLISLGIMLSSSICAVVKGRNSFFLLCSIPLCKCTTVFWSTPLLMGT